MPELRITWAELLSKCACSEAKPIFDRFVTSQGHGVPDTMVFPGGWDESWVKACMALPGGPYWLHFLEAKGFVPVVESDAKRFPKALAPHRMLFNKRRVARGLSAIRT